MCEGAEAWKVSAENVERKRGRGVRKDVAYGDTGISAACGERRAANRKKKLPETAEKLYKKKTADNKRGRRNEIRKFEK